MLKALKSLIKWTLILLGIFFVCWCIIHRRVIYAWLTGGEMPAAMMTDAIVRLLPGALGDVESALGDSFQDGLLEPGVYTRPAEYKGWRVPDILISGNQAKIEEWLYEESLRHTAERRPDLLED